MTSEALLFDGKYKLVRQIGEGGMGTVHEAINARTGRKVAIKVMSPLVAKDSGAIERFMREARAATSIEHPNVVQVLDVGVDASNVPYMVMELLQGESLAALIEREAPIAPGRAVQMLGPVLGALAAAHELGIIHRDLKPENIFLMRTPGTGIVVPKLLDFGISKSLNADPGDMSLTHTGTVLGTPYYMAPEQAAGKRTIDRRTDVYSVGVILYYALSGKLPFNGDNYNMLIVAILSETPPPLPESVPAPIARVLEHAMARDMTQRFGSVGELLGALGEAVGVPMLDTSSMQSDMRFVQASITARQQALAGATPQYGTPLTSSDVYAIAPPITGVHPAPMLAPVMQTPMPMQPAFAPSVTTMPLAHDEPMRLPTSKAPLIALVVIALLVLVGGSIGAMVWMRGETPPPAPVATVVAPTLAPVVIAPPVPAPVVVAPPAPVAVAIPTGADVPEPVVAPIAPPTGVHVEHPHTEHPHAHGPGHGVSGGLDIDEF